MSDETVESVEAQIGRLVEIEEVPKSVFTLFALFFGLLAIGHMSNGNAGAFIALVLLFSAAIWMGHIIWHQAVKADGTPIRPKRKQAQDLRTTGPEDQPGWSAYRRRGQH